MKSVMDHSFSQIPRIDHPRSSFDRSSSHKTTFDVGRLIPIYHDEVLPGDTFNLNASCLCRLNTPIFPIMDNMFMDIHFFFVPYRQVWDNFRKFMGEQVDPGDSIDFIVPKRVITNGITENVGKIEDYLGLPVEIPLEYNALYLRSYLHIYNEWYRDQNLRDSLTFNTDDTGGTDTDGYDTLKRGKRHDYFTSCLPFLQKGDDVVLPMAGSAPVTGIGITGLATTGSLTPGTTDGSSPNPEWTDFWQSTHATNQILVQEDPNNEHYPNIRADLTNAASATINQLREAFAIQRFLEQDARAGTRYAEIVNSHFGVKFFDVTYRPEFLGGGSIPVNINPVAQTSSTDATTPQGNLAAFGTVGGSGIGFNKSFNEHGIVMGIASVRADLTYQQGIARCFNRTTRYDFYWPAFANIGEQAVLNQEIYYQNDDANDHGVFGYQERYGEYRYKPSIITGKMRSNVTGSLDAWHLSEEFGSLPTLGATFIDDNTPIDRCVALPTEPDFTADFYFSQRSARCMPLFGVPGMGGRF
jgi:hypothetical protein